MNKSTTPITDIVHMLEHKESGWSKEIQDISKNYQQFIFRRPGTGKNANQKWKITKEYEDKLKGVDVTIEMPYENQDMFWIRFDKKEREFNGWGYNFN